MSTCDWLAGDSQCMELAPLRAHVHFGEGDSRVIAVFDPLLPGEQRAGLEKWVIRKVKVRLGNFRGVETQCEVWVERLNE
jgi:hypothetical protein